MFECSYVPSLLDVVRLAEEPSPGHMLFSTYVLREGMFLLQSWSDLVSIALFITEMPIFLGKLVVVVEEVGVRVEVEKIVVVIVEGVKVVLVLKVVLGVALLQLQL